MRRNQLTPVTGCHRPSMGWCAKLGSHVSVPPQCQDGIADTVHSCHVSSRHLIMPCIKVCQQRQSPSAAGMGCILDTTEFVFGLALHVHTL